MTPEYTALSAFLSACQDSGLSGNQMRVAMATAMRATQITSVRPPQGLPYGIVDPDYARIFSIARTLAWSEGYAIAMQGSFTRDLDMVAIPWTDAACEPDHLIKRIEVATDTKRTPHPPGVKPHGRLAWTLLMPNFGDPRFIDISVVPRVAATPEVPELDRDQCAKIYNAANKITLVYPTATPAYGASADRTVAAIQLAYQLGAKHGKAET
jgi:hypothetical protein